MLDVSDTIVALASHPGPAPRGVVRLSGPDALRIALDGFECREGVSPAIPRWPWSRPGCYRLADPPARLPATLLLWPGPRSYTGQSVAEIHTVGSPPLLQHVTARCLALGARAAEPGEFTLRAFLSGRLDLSQAEAVLGVIEAETPGALESALDQLAGGVASPARLVRDRLLDRLVEIEANLDFVDESDVSAVERAALLDDLATSAARLDEVLAMHRRRDRVEARPRVVLAGPPNAGKSRLFNALIGEDHAIVSPLAGTTRDALIAACTFDGVALDLVDLAGEDAPSSSIETAAQSHRAAHVDRADLVLRCDAADGPPGVHGGDDRTLRVVTKVDLAAVPHRSAAVLTSAATGRGIDVLRTAIAARLRAAARSAAVDVGARAREGLGRAVDSLRVCIEVASGPGGEELIAAELRQAVDDLGKVVGAVVTEDLLDQIFRRFCVGK